MDLLSQFLSPVSEYYVYNGTSRVIIYTLNQSKDDIIFMYRLGGVVVYKKKNTELVIYPILVEVRFRPFQDGMYRVVC